MRHFLVLSSIFLIVVSFNVTTKNFSGKIIYENTFVNSKNQDITKDMSSFFGKENIYFINDSNYRAYNENNELMYLYNSSANAYFDCDTKEKTAEKINAETVTSKKIKVKIVSDSDTICGFVCSCVEIKTESGTTKYFFTPLISVDKKYYSKHNYGEWNSCLDATNGAVPLKIVYKDKEKGYTWTSKAKEVTNLIIQQKDFELPKEITLKN